MENWLLLTFVAIAVSLDSFVVGFGVSLNKKQSILLPVAVALATLTLCALTSLLGSVVFRCLQDNVHIIGFAVLFALGVASLYKKDDVSPLGALSVEQCLSIGFTVALDGAMANFSLMGQNFGIVAPLTITAVHFVAVLLGQKLASKAQGINTKAVSAVTLFAMALLKLFG